MTLSGHAVVDRLSRALPGLAADLLEIAASIHAIDRLVPRLTERQRPTGVVWTRSLRADIPVRDPDRWRQQIPLLSQLLHWLTDDDWSVEFSPLQPGAGMLDTPQQFLFETVPDGAVPVLFSGGLDSAAGLASELLHGDAVGISMHTNGWMDGVQRRVLAALNEASHHQCVPLRYRISVRNSTEASQRSRGLLFLAAGVATAWAMHQDHLRVFENGIGAVNLPFLRSQQGAQATKSVHPLTLRMVQDLASAVSGRSFVIDAPAMALTKAELLRCAPSAAGKALGLTVSCDVGFAARVPEHRACGACTSCLLRLQSLTAAGLTGLLPMDIHERKGHDREFNLNAMIWQATRMRACLESPEPWQRMVSEFPDLIHVTSLTQQEVVRLYRAYVQEWSSNEDAVRSRGLARRDSRTVA
ncbi:MAG TPA: 7-cyano-7-deazaguanine synthase [Streptosporangiaceae bacterium]|nr:7-cyano-7-deazaguanine synthase [Streptosporangiaceae bacterium]